MRLVTELTGEGASLLQLLQQGCHGQTLILLDRAIAACDRRNRYASLLELALVDNLVLVLEEQLQMLAIHPDHLVAGVEVTGWCEVVVLDEQDQPHRPQWAA